MAANHLPVCPQAGLQQVQAGEECDQHPFGAQAVGVGLMVVVNLDDAAQDALAVYPAVWPGAVIGFEQQMAIPDAHHAMNHQSIRCRADESQHIAQARRALRKGRQGDQVAVSDQGGHADTGCLEAERAPLIEYSADHRHKLLVGQLFSRAVERSRFDQLGDGHFN